MLFSNAPCSWGINYPTGNRVDWRQYLEEVAAAGYRGTELGPFGYMPRDAALVRAELERRGLALVGSTHVHTFGDREALPRLLADLRELGPLLTALGAGHLVIMDEDGFYPADRKGVLDAAGWKGLVEGVETARRLIEEELGLKASFHPHVGTAVQFEAEIDRLLGETEIDLCFDTGHHAFWGQDAVGYLNAAWDRIGYIHLKNVDAAVRRRVLDGELSIAEAFAAGIMCPLPDGVVNIPAVMSFIEAMEFSGPVVVEQDLAQDAAESPLALARRNIAFLREIA